MLFNINEDFSEATDLAKENPGKLEPMKQLWWAMTSKYKVLPLDGRGIERLMTPRPEMSGPRDKYVYYPGTGEVEASTAVDVRNRSHTITAEVAVKKGDEGVLLAMGSSFAGWTFFVNKDQKLQYSHNYLGFVYNEAATTEKLPEGKLSLSMKF